MLFGLYAISGIIGLHKSFEKTLVYKFSYIFPFNKATWVTLMKTMITNFFPYSVSVQACHASINLTILRFYKTNKSYISLIFVTNTFFVHIANLSSVGGVAIAQIIESSLISNVFMRRHDRIMKILIFSTVFGFAVSAIAFLILQFLKEDLMKIVIPVLYLSKDNKAKFQFALETLRFAPLYGLFQCFYFVVSSLDQIPLKLFC